MSLAVGALAIAGAAVAQLDHGSGHDMHGAMGHASKADHQMKGHARKAGDETKDHEVEPGS